MNEKNYRKLVGLVEKLEWGEMFDLMEAKDITPEELYIEIMNNKCKGCKANQCNNCSFYAFKTNYVDNEILYQMGYLDEDYCFIFD